jgi:putative intracellular protease/amidase
MPAVTTGLPSHARVLAELASAERAEGWLARCADAGRYVTLHRTFVDALARVLRPLAAGRGPVLEVCAGDGTLAAALRAHGVAVVATDADPPPGAIAVERLTASDALRLHDPAVVLGCFVPYDAGVDRQVLDHPGVRDYVVLNARLAGALGADCLWTRAGWDRRRLAAVATRMLCRHDVWLDDAQPVLRFGEAWCLSRQAGEQAAVDHPPRRTP